ncbi:MAG: glycosyltransferase family 4 protein [Bacteroidetes bacterium]|nr:glycosyltransferase family 4 protein [Bacteroidota bacterium]
MKKLLIVGSNSVHTFNYIDLIKEYFDDILLVTNKLNPDSTIPQVTANFHYNFTSFFATPKKIKEVVEQFSPTHIHVHQANSYAFFTARAISKKENMFLTAWGSDILLLPKRSFFWKKMVQYSLNRFSFFTADSQEVADQIIKLVTVKNRVLVANFGIEIHEVSTKKENVIYSNRLHKPLYRVNKVIGAFHRFLQTNPTENWKLVIGAVGTETDKLKEMVTELGIENQVEFVGWVDNELNRNYYAKSKFWISLPESDATSISLLEAMAYGCVPIVSNLPSNKEWIKEGENGFIVQDLEEEYLSEMLSFDLEKAVSLNKERIRKDGTKEANRKKFIQLYEQLSK